MVMYSWMCVHFMESGQPIRNYTLKETLSVSSSLHPHFFSSKTPQLRVELHAPSLPMACFCQVLCTLSQFLLIHMYSCLLGPFKLCFLQLSTTPVSNNISIPFFEIIAKPWKEGCDVVASFQAEHSIVTLALHFDQLGVSVLMAIYCRRKKKQKQKVAQELRDALICRFNNVIRCQFNTMLI